MSDPVASDPVANADDKALDPAAASLVARVRWLMAIAAATTLVAMAAVLGVIGYRVFKAEGSAAAADVTAPLPKSARVVAITAANDRIVVTIELAGALEARTFDLRTLKPTGRLRFVPEP
jgi:heme/copper-type cytochrome/quinol oxidase subunit 2